MPVTHLRTDVLPDTDDPTQIQGTDWLADHVVALESTDVPSGIDAAKIADGSVSNAEFQYLNGAVSPIQQQINNRFPHPVFRQAMWMNGVGPATSLTPVAVNTNGNGSLIGTLTEISDATFHGGRLTTTAVIGNAVGIQGPSNGAARVDADPVTYILMRTGADIADIRLWLGVSTQTMGNNDNSSATARYAMFRYSTVAGDTGWVGCCGDAGGAQTVTAQVAAIAADTVYLLRIRFSDGGTQVHFSVNGSAEVTIITNVPTSTFKLFWEHRLYTQAAAAKSWDWAVSYTEYSRVSTNLPNPW